MPLSSRQRAAGVGRPITVRDSEGVVHSFMMDPLTDEDFAYMDGWLQSRAIERAVEASLKFSAEIRAEVIQNATIAAQRMAFMTPEGAAQTGTCDGLAQLLWLSIRKRHTEYTPDQLRGLIFSKEGSSTPANVERVTAAFTDINYMEQADDPKKKQMEARHKKAAKKRKQKARDRKRST